MEDVGEQEWKPKSAQTLLWCCFCDARFERPALLSAHLDRYNVNWKLYWQLFYSGRAGKACVLCNVLHADRKSLECHFKMVHCITGHCATRGEETTVIEIESSKGPPETSLDDKKMENILPDHPDPPQLEDEQEDPQVVKPESIDDIDVLFEINIADATRCEASSAATPESPHLALRSTLSEQEQSPRSGDDVEVLPHNVEEPRSIRNASQSSRDGDAGLIIPDSIESGKPMTPVTFAVLQPNDIVEKLGSDDLTLLSPSQSTQECKVILSDQADAERCGSPEVINIEDDDASMPAESSQRTEIPPPCVDLPVLASFPTESRHARPTAVVNPFDEQGESRSSSITECERSDVELPRVSIVVPGPSRAPRNQRSEQGSPVSAMSASLVSDLIAVVEDEVDSDSEIGAPTPLSGPLRRCRTPPVNPFDAHGARRSSSITDCVRSDVELPRVSIVPGPSRALISQRHEQGSPVPAMSASLASDLIAVVEDEVDSGSEFGEPAALSDPLRHCRTPPVVLGDVEKELGENWQDRASSTVTSAVPDLSRLTPSKIAAFMNKGVFSAKHQSDIEKHLEERKTPLRVCSDTDSDEWEADSKESRTSRAGAASGISHESLSAERHIGDVRHSFLSGGSAMQPSMNSEEEDESLPFGFNIVSVESLLPKSLPSSPDKGMKRGTGRPRRSRKRSCCQKIEGMFITSDTGMRGKRTLTCPDDGSEAQVSLATSQPVKGHDLSPTRKKKSRHDSQCTEEAQLPSGGSKGVFKQPIGLCVGVIRPGSLVEVSTARVPRTSKARDSLDGMVMKAEETDSSIRYLIHFPNMDKRLDRWVSKEDIIQVYRTEEELTQQDTSTAMPSSSPLNQAKRRLAFAPSPEGRRPRSASPAHTTFVQLERAASPRPSSDLSHQLAIPAKGRRAREHRRPGGRRSKFVNTRLVQLRKQGMVTNGNHSKRMSKFLKHVKFGTRTATQTMETSTNCMSLRSKRTRTDVTGAAAAQFRNKNDAAMMEAKQEVSSEHQTEQLEGPVGIDSEAKRAPSVKAACTVGFSVSQTSSLSDAAGDAPKCNGTQRCVSDADVPVQSATAAGQNAAPPNGASTKIARRRLYHVKKHPPRGVTIRPFVDSMLDRLRPGMLVYVICNVMKSGWLRVYPAKIREVVERELFHVHVHYLGFRSSHNEWVAPELIHSVMDVQGKIPQRTLHASWLVKSEEETPPKEREEGADSTPPKKDRQIELSQSSIPEQPNAVEDVRGSDSSAKRGASIPREGKGLRPTMAQIVTKPRHRGSRARMSDNVASVQHVFNSHSESPPPTLSREHPARLPVGAQTASPDASPPSLALEAGRNMAPATRRSAATTGRGNVDFWMSVADVHNDKTARRARVESTPATFSSDASVPLPATPAHSAVESLAGTGNVEIVASKAPHFNSSANLCASLSCRRPLKKFVTAQRHRSPAPVDVVKATGPGARSSEIATPSAAKGRRERPVESPTAQPIGSVSQLPGTDEPPSTKRRRGRPVKGHVVASVGPPAAKLSTGPTGTPVNAEVQPVQKMMLEQLSAPPSTSAAADASQSGRRVKQNTVDRPADPCSLQAGLTSPCSDLTANPLTAVASRSKRGMSRNTSGVVELSSQVRKRPASTAVPSTSFQPRVVDASLVDLATPPDDSVSSTFPAALALANRAKHPPKETDGLRPIDGEKKQGVTSNQLEERPQRRSLRCATPVADQDTLAALVPEQTPPPLVPTPSDPAASAGKNRDGSFDRSGVAAMNLGTPCTQEEIRSLRAGSVVYVVYEEKEDGAKFVYPAKIMQLNKELYYVRFRVHYIGWPNRYDEWIAEEVIHSIVDPRLPNTMQKYLKQHVVPPPRYPAQASQIRRCSVDLSVNNICFFSALRKGRFSVNDHRIHALRTAVGNSEQNGGEVTN